MTKGRAKIELSAELRQTTGSKVKFLRKSGYIPAVLYGKGQDSLNLQIKSSDFSKALKEAGESTLVYVNLGKDSHPTIIHDVTRDPVRDEVIHADFYKVNLHEKIDAKVPVVFQGESPAVKNLGGIFVRNVNELEVEALPQNLPHELTIDISVLKEFGDKITIADLKRGLGDLAELTAEDDDAIIATVQEPKSQEELEADLAEPTKGVEDVEVIEKVKESETEEESQEKTGE